MLAVAGYWLLFTTFMVYDDEGYVLLSLKNFSAHGALYDQVYSQYGPFFYVAYDALHRLLGFAWTNTSGRWLTLGHWSATALVCALLVWRRTRSAGATAVTLAGVFTYLWVMVHEPGHPGGSIGLLVALAAWMGTETNIAQSRWAAGAVGAIGAALTLTKINVGALMLIAATVWLVVHASEPRVRRWGGGAVVALLALAPCVLMFHLLDQGWVQEYAFVVVLGALAAYLAALTCRQPVSGLRTWAALVAGTALVTVVTGVIVLARGSSPGGLIGGVLLDPLRQPGVYFFPFNWRPGTLVLAVGGCALTAWIWHAPEAAVPRRTIALLRGMLAAACVLSAIQILPVSLPAFGLSYGVAMAGLCAVPLGRAEDTLGDARARQWLALLLVLQSLHAYPVAGSQMNWGTFLWVPLLVLAVREAWRGVVPSTGSLGRYLAAAGALAAFALSYYMAGRLLTAALTNRQHGEPLGLPGAEGIVIPDDTVFALRTIAENATAHADVLFSLPGVFSFNLWTGLPTPTLANATHWFSLLSADRQEAIIASLARSPRACLVIQMDTLKYIVAHGFHPSGPLAEYLGRNFHNAFTVDNYAFWVRQGRDIAPLSTGRMRPAPNAPGSQTLELTLRATPTGIASIELWTLETSTRVQRLTLTAANATLEETMLQESGEPIGRPQPLAWNVSLPRDSITRIDATFHGDPGPTDKLAAFVFDAHGRRIAVARVLP